MVRCKETEVGSRADKLEEMKRKEKGEGGREARRGRGRQARRGRGRQ